MACIHFDLLYSSQSLLDHVHVSYTHTACTVVDIPLPILLYDTPELHTGSQLCYIKPDLSHTPYVQFTHTQAIARYNRSIVHVRPVICTLTECVADSEVNTGGIVIDDSDAEHSSWALILDKLIREEPHLGNCTRTHRERERVRRRIILQRVRVIQ